MSFGLEPSQSFLNLDALLLRLDRSPFPDRPLAGFPLCAFLGGLSFASFADDMLSCPFHFLVEERRISVRGTWQVEGLRLEFRVRSERAMEPDTEFVGVLERLPTLAGTLPAVV